MEILIRLLLSPNKHIYSWSLNDTMLMQTADKTVHYQVYDMQVVDSKTYTLQQNSDGQTLVLVTCYPFDSLAGGGSLRYLVYAIASNKHIKEMPEVTKTI